MKKISILLIFVIALGAFTACNNSNATEKVKKENLDSAKERDVKIKEGAASISFDKTEYDFGTVDEGEVVKVTYKVTNTGKTDLVITNAQPSCGCTVPVWPKEPIKPGETADLKVEFNTAGKPNKQMKTITLTTNTAVGREVVKLSGSVVPKAKS